LAKEGEKRNIRVNTICPLAASRMTETVLPKEVLENIKPEFVAPFVAFLCHDSCEETGSLFEVGAGYVAKMRWQRSAGVLFPLKEFNIENIKSKFE
jgi:NAD(P)-dependent dehydrogenase (short-subunit alcohol dehydrogenase family)